MGQYRTMFAALITGKGSLDLVEVPDPEPTAGAVVVDIAFCGICGTDIHAYQSGNPYNPAICGHEWSGVVSATGSGVTEVGDGDRVVVAVPPPCGDCTACRAGQADRCLTTFTVAVGRDPLAPAHGGFAQRIAVGAARLVKTNPALSDEQAAQVEPATVAFHAVRNSGLRLGDLAVVQGAGPIGLTTMQLVWAAGAGQVVVIEPNPERRELAARLGATVVTVPDKAGPIIKELSKGLGADIVYECVGRAPAIQSAVDFARRGGSMCLIGVADTDATIDPRTWLVKEIMVRASLAYVHEEFEMTMAMIADGRISLEPMHSSTTNLQGLAGVLEDLAGGNSTQTKVLVNPNW